jgi:hypothetical protein
LNNVKTVKIKKQLFYKQAEFLQPSTVPLQDYLRRALKQMSVIQRQEPVGHAMSASGGVDTWLRLINSPRNDAGFQLGTLVSYSPGTNHLVLSQAASEAGDELDVSKLGPPDGKHFIESPLYFGVRDNHVVILQSRNLRAEALESHLNWLLKHAGQIDDEQRIVLTDVIPEEIKQKLRKKPITKVLMRAPFFEAQGNDEEAVGARILRPAKAGTGLGLSILKAIMPSQQYQALKVEEMNELNSVQLNLEIKIAGRQKKKSGATENDMMRTLLRAIRNVPDTDFVQVEIEGAGTTKGNDLRVHDNVHIDSIDGVLATASAYQALTNWLETLIDKGVISPHH